jgi:hypothetical protein
MISLPMNPASAEQMERQSSFFSPYMQKKRREMKALTAVASVLQADNGCWNGGT